MKLYATTTSERASKGQGGNEYLYIKVMVRDGDKDIELADFYVHETITDFEIIDNHKCEVIAKVLKLERNKKGKSQKGDYIDVLEAHKRNADINNIR
jgi:hypothetical protein